ncbi:MAG: hypothetical protein QJR09_03905 [Micrococcus sp.]|nr:hypothetical protein [Micrococcus sp.]
MRTTARTARTVASLALAAALAGGVVSPALASPAPVPVPVAASGTAAASEPARADVVAYQVSGTEVTGGTALSAAVEVQPGLYRDVIEASEDSTEGGESSRYYRLPALEEGERAHVSAVLALDASASRSGSGAATIGVQFLNEQGEDCGMGDSDYTVSGGQGVPVAATSSGPMDPESLFGCFEDGSGVVIAQVSRSGAWQADEPVPVELRFAVEPAVDESALAEAPSSDLPPESVTTTGQASEVTGGTSFTTATELAPGQVYSTELEPLQSGYFRVPVQYGQRLNYRLSTGNNQDSRVSLVRTDLYGPLLVDASTIGSDTLSYNDAGGTITHSTAVAVSPDNYDSSYGSLRHAGDYYIVVDAGTPRGGRQGSEPFRVELAVELTGDPAGSTEWLAAAQDEQAADGGEAAEGDDAQAASARDAGGWLPSTTELGALLGGVGLGAVLTGVAWLLLRRRRHSA